MRPPVPADQVFVLLAVPLGCRNEGWETFGRFTTLEEYVERFKKVSGSKNEPAYLNSLQSFLVLQPIISGGLAVCASQENWKRHSLARSRVSYPAG